MNAGKGALGKATITYQCGENTESVIRAIIEDGYLVRRKKDVEKS